MEGIHKLPSNAAVSAVLLPTAGYVFWHWRFPGLLWWDLASTRNLAGFGSSKSVLPILRFWWFWVEVLILVTIYHVPTFSSAKHLVPWVILQGVGDYVGLPLHPMTLWLVQTI
jgi:hypothetical protein